MKKRKLAGILFNSIKSIGFKQTYKFTLDNWEKEIKFLLEHPATEELKNKDDAKELLDELLINFVALNDISLVKTIENPFNYLYSFKPSLITKECDFAFFNSLINKPDLVYLLLGNDKWIHHLLNAFPSCMETLSKLDSFISSTNKIIEDYKGVIDMTSTVNLILEADYKKLKEELNNTIENSSVYYIDPIRTTRFGDIYGFSRKRVYQLEDEFGKQMREWYTYITNDELYKVLVPDDELALDFAFKSFLDELSNIDYKYTIESIKEMSKEVFINELEIAVDSYVKKFTSSDREHIKSSDLPKYEFTIWIGAHYNQIFIHTKDKYRPEFIPTYRYKGEWCKELFRLTNKELYAAIYHYYTRGFRIKPTPSKNDNNANKNINSDKSTYTQLSLFQ